MSDKRQKIQLELAFTEISRSEAPRDSAEGTEALMAKRDAESMAISEQLMEEVCERRNCEQALARVKSNKGSAGIDGMSVEQLPSYLKKHWPIIREQLLSSTHKPQVVKRVEIPKPDGRVRQLGIPTVLDRFIPASGNASTTTQLGPSLLRTQLRVPARAFSTSGSNQSTAIYCGGTQLGGGLGPGEVLRPSQSRQTDGEAGTANQ